MGFPSRFGLSSRTIRRPAEHDASLPLLVALPDVDHHVPHQLPADAVAGFPPRQHPERPDRRHAYVLLGDKRQRISPAPETGEFAAFRSEDPIRPVLGTGEQSLLLAVFKLTLVFVPYPGLKARGLRQTGNTNKQPPTGHVEETVLEFDQLVPYSIHVIVRVFEHVPSCPSRHQLKPGRLRAARRLPPAPGSRCRLKAPRRPRCGSHPR